MEIKVWNGAQIRFVDVKGEWYAVGKDVAEALGYSNASKAVLVHVDNEDKRFAMLDITHSQNGNVPTGKSKTAIINELGIYSLIMSSKLQKTKEFKRWVFEIIKSFREASGLQSFDAFRMMDKEHQKKCMDIIHGFKEPTKVNYIKANTIADKAVSIKYGLPKMIKKGDMTPEMLVDRQKLLDSTVELMATNDKFNLELKVSETIYKNVKCLN